MRTILSFLAIALLLVSCGEKRGGKRIVRFRGPKIDTKKVAKEGLRIATLKTSSLEVSTDNRGLVEKSKIIETNKRYLREKILNHSFLNFSGEEAKGQLRITFKDEFRFFPGEILKKTKTVLANEDGLQAGELGGWKVQGALSFSSITKGVRLSDIIIALGSYSHSEREVNYFGSDLLRGRNGQPLVFTSKNKKKDFLLSYADIPLSSLRKMTSLNSNFFLELMDFSHENENMNDYIQNSRKGHSRLIISTPEKEQFFFMKGKTNLREFLKGIDKNAEFDYRGHLINLFGKKQDDMFARPDRNLLNDIENYGDKKVWWTNVHGDLGTSLADGSTIILSYSSYKELRGTRYRWQPLNKNFVDNLSFSEEEGEKVFGRIEKYAKTFSYNEFSKVIPFEFATEVCLEDRRFERKAVDCHMVWKPVTTYPTAVFRRQITTPFKKVDFKADELMTSRKTFQEEFLEDEVGKNGIEIELVKPEEINMVSGGFVRWSSFDQGLNHYETRAPFDNLSSYKIKKGSSSKYEFKGWVSNYLPVD